MYGKLNKKTMVKIIGINNTLVLYWYCWIYIVLNI